MASEQQGGSFFKRHGWLVNVLLSLAIFAVLAAGSEYICGHFFARGGVTWTWGSLAEQNDPVLCYRLKPNSSVVDRCTQGGKVLFELPYHTDAQGLRVTVVDHPEQRMKFAAFFGCSFTFGQGVRDEDTMESSFGRLAPDYMPYNFGCPGYSPQQTLLMMQEPIEKKIVQQKGIGIYTFILPHINRAIGGMNMVNNWGIKFAHYELRNGELVREGTFETAHRWRNRLFWLLGKSKTLKAFRIGWPMWFSEYDYALTARIIGEAAKIFRQKWSGSEFYVLIYPDPLVGPYVPILTEHFNRVGVRTLYFEDVLDSIPLNKRTADGGHPTAEVHRLVMERLVQELKLNEPAKNGSV